MYKSTFKLFSVTLFVLALGLVPAQAKSDFSGTWKANMTKSDFGPMPPPDTLVEKIMHEDPSLKVNVAQTGGTGDMNFDMVYTTDGKECVNSPGGNEWKTTINWDGDDLVADTKGTFGDFDFTAKDRWILSDAGKTLTVQRHVTSSMGEADMKLVFDKQ
ncbi:MAG TPA: hypothetical protein VMG35_23955 [Bryobacteraceae bacterium]|nr:hypothetical protein [Bryobacteraceae bacterium]